MMPMMSVVPMMVVVVVVPVMPVVAIVVGPVVHDGIDVAGVANGDNDRLRVVVGVVMPVVWMSAEVRWCSRCSYCC
jgi:hypothetical protein